MNEEFEMWWREQLPTGSPERDRRLPAYKEVWQAAEKATLAKLGHCKCTFA